MGKIKCLFICSSLEQTGPTKQLFYIIKNNLDFVEFFIVTLSKEKERSLIDDFLELPIKINQLDIASNGFIKTINKVKKLDNACGFHVVHSQGIKGDFVSSILFSKKNISTLRNFPYEDYPALYGKIKGAALAWLHLFIMKRIKLRVTVSGSTCEKIKNCSNLYFNVVYNGVDIKTFIQENGGEVINGSVKKNNLTFVYSGPLIKRKQVSLLVECFKNRDDFHLIILGDGPEMESLKGISTGNIKFIGQVDDVSTYLRKADVFISFSNSEGYPNSVLEALASKLPCILSNIPSHKDVQTAIGESVLLLSDNELNSFLDSSCEIEVSKLKSTIEKDYNVILSKISCQNMAKQYSSLYKKIAEPH